MLCTNYSIWPPPHQYNVSDCLCWFQGPTPQQYNVSELNQRFGLELDLTNDAIQERLKEIQERIRKEILTEMKIKEGAENLRKVRVSTKAVMLV